VKARVAATVLATVVLVAAARADACSIVENAPHAIDTTRQDNTPPEPPTDVSVIVNRAFRTESGGCGESDSSCDGFANIQVLLNAPATDDQTAAANMGYRVEVVDGTPPRGVSIPTEAVRAMNGTELFFGWFDGDTEAQEVIAFSITLTPVDERGNIGPTSDPIRIYDPGSSDGCTTPRRAPSLDAALLLMLAGALGRAFQRRRRAA
jgi:hypothetical protein